MKSFTFGCALISFCVLISAQHANVDPAYLRQYYQQLQQQQQHQQQSADVTPIYEQNTEQSQQYVRPGGAQHAQLRLKDTVQDQIRAKQQQTGGYVAPAVREYLQQQQQQPQYQTQPIYRPQAQTLSNGARHQSYQQQQQVAAANKAKLQEEEEYDDQNSSYQFGFDVKDDEFTNYQNRKEVRDGGVIKGSYSVVDSDGFIRTVKYTADPKEGFKAEVIREPTDIVVKIPTPAPQQLLRTSLKASGQDYHAKQQYDQQQYHQYQ